MIKIRNLNKTYFGASPLHVLKGVDLDINRGEFVSIMGASGSGKSTLLNILGILDSYDSGEYILDNVLIRNLSESKAATVRNQKIGFIFQSFNLISFKNAMENVALPLYYQGVSRKKRNALALEYLNKMGLKAHANHLPNELSGGQKQRVAIARALIAQPQIILADEPTGALDSKTSDEVMKILREVNKVNGITMIIVTHEQAVADATDKIIHFKDGLIHNIEDTRLKNTQNVKVGDTEEEILLDTSDHTLLEKDSIKGEKQTSPEDPTESSITKLTNNKVSLSDDNKLKKNNQEESLNTIESPSQVDKKLTNQLDVKKNSSDKKNSTKTSSITSEQRKKENPGRKWQYI